MNLISLAAIALATLIAAPVGAADQTILGSIFQVKDPSVNPIHRKAQVKAKEKASPNTLVGNPVTSGATLTIRVAGGTPSQQIIPLPQGMASNGKPFWSGDATKGFKYRDSAGQQGPVKSVRIKKYGTGPFSLQVQATGKVMPFTVTPPNPGTSACVLLDINGGDSYSVQFAGGVIINKGDKEYTHKKVSTEGTCVPTCSDGIQNGTESDIDCGGASCSTCADGDSCTVPGDCTSGVCTLGICQIPLCTDGVANGTETDIDCGGGCPLNCDVDQACGSDLDCVTAHCSSGLCKCPNNLYTSRC